MRLPIFLAGLAAAALVAFILGILAGFGAGKVAIFVIAVVVVAQLAYVGLVALLAASRRRKGADESESRPRVPRQQVSQRHDT